MILASIWRNSADYIDRYASQVHALREALGKDQKLQVVAVEGDSTDDTYDRLVGKSYHVLKCEHGGRLYGSVKDATRWRQLSLPCNTAMTAAIRLSDGKEPIVYVESDLIWSPVMLQGLLHDLLSVPAVSPMSFHWKDPTLFYDRWGYVKDGREFTVQPPWFPGLHGLTRIDSSGSCFALRADVAPYVEFSTEDCVRGVGRSLRAADVELWLDPDLAVYHP